LSCFEIYLNAFSLSEEISEFNERTFIYEGRELVRRKCSSIETNSFNEEEYSINTQYFHYFDNESDNIFYFVQNE